MPTPNHPDARVARAAKTRHGLVTRALALSCGLTDRQIAARLRDGRWEVVARGVYRVAAVPITDEQTLYAGILAAGGGALASALSALALVGVGRFPNEPQIIVPPEASSRHPGLRVRRSPIESTDRTSVGCIPTTTAARGLLDAAPLLSDDLLAERLDDVLDRRLATPAGVLGVIRRAPIGHGRWGAPRLRDALSPWVEGLRPGSPAEVRLLRRIADWGVPAPVKQHRVVLPGRGWVDIDLAWPEHRVGLEYDGQRHHGPRELGHDVEREERLRAEGWWIGRVDRHDLAPSSTRVRDELLPRLRRAA